MQWNIFKKSEPDPRQKDHPIRVRFYFVSGREFDVFFKVEEWDEFKTRIKHNRNITLETETFNLNLQNVTHYLIFKS